MRLTESLSNIANRGPNPCAFSPANSWTLPASKQCDPHTGLVTRGTGGPAGAPGLTAFRQHALFHLLQLLVAVPEFSQRLEHPLAGPHALPTGHAAVAPLRPRRQQAWDGV